MYFIANFRTDGNYCKQPFGFLPNYGDTVYREPERKKAIKINKSLS